MEFENSRRAGAQGRTLARIRAPRRDLPSFSHLSPPSPAPLRSTPPFPSRPLPSPPGRVELGLPAGANAQSRAGAAGAEEVESRG